MEHRGSEAHREASEPCQGEEMGSVAGPGGSRTLRTRGQGPGRQGPGRPQALAPLSSAEEGVPAAPPTAQLLQT
ncbi:unnamed protein product [Gulo gulo]|uniref:Uncharacterized protein n=1 Tax=Gulo gulo TaxID=48420 RepID=A0A9X9LHR1_GULGU|nr:unnamed protein product [Gulo gulo]